MIRYRHSWNGKLILQIKVSTLDSKEVYEDTIPATKWRDATFQDYQRMIAVPIEDEEEPIGFKK